MRTGSKAWILAGLLAAVGAGLLAVREPAQAGIVGTCTAFVGGASSAKGAVPELVIFNTQTGSYTLDLKLLGPDGTVLIDRPGEITVGPYQTLNIDLLEQFKRGLGRNEKPYSGTFTVQLDGENGFSADLVLVHVAQYFGTKARPKAAYVLRPAFRDNGT